MKLANGEQFDLFNSSLGKKFKLSNQSLYNISTALIDQSLVAWPGVLLNSLALLNIEGQKEFAFGLTFLLLSEHQSVQAVKGWNEEIPMICCLDWTANANSISRSSKMKRLNPQDHDKQMGFIYQ